MLVLRRALLAAGAAAAVTGASLGVATVGAVAGPPPAGGDLASQAAALQSSLVTTGQQLHQLAVATLEADRRLAADRSALAASEQELAGLRSALQRAELLSRRLALATYMDFGSSEPSEAFAAVEHGTSTELTARQAYATLASDTESTAIDRYLHLRVQLAAEVRRESAEQVAATAAYGMLAARYQAMQQTARHEQAMLDAVRQQAAAAAQAAQAAQAAAPASVPYTVMVSANGSLAEDLARLRQCESGDDYQANTGNGYYGAYQFSLATWEGLGYQGLPSQAPPPEQDQAAITLEQRDGWGQWPVCAALLGLD